MTWGNGLALNGQSKLFCRGPTAEDRISNLPEAVMSHILSFLSTEDAVRTSVLSTKWVYLWTNVTTLHFDDHSLFSRKGRNKKLRFMNFVERVLLLGSPTIQSFYFSSLDSYDASRLHSWISAAIRRSAQKLNICCPLRESMVFPRCLFGSNSLKELKLEMSCTLKVPTSVSFSGLKILQLYWVTFSNESSSRSSELHFSLPLLEVLSLERCKWQNVKLVDIEAPVLNSFRISHFAGIDVLNHCVVKIRAARLTKFECYGYPSVDIIFVSPSSLVGASIWGYGATPVHMQNHKIGMLTCTLLKPFFNLKYLTLSADIIESLASLNDLQVHIPTLNHLIQLTTTLGYPGLGGTLVALLQSFPVLESLILPWESTAWFDDKVVPPCFQTHLKVVKFQYFEGTTRGLELAKFLLKNAMVLEELMIISDSSLQCHSGSAIEAVKEKLLALPRGSDCASISFIK